MIIRLAQVAVLLGSLFPALGRAEGPVAGKLAPFFALYTPDRSALITLSDMVYYRGRPKPLKPKKAVVIDFFRTDCAPCRRGLPKLAELHKRFSTKSVQVILIAMLEDEEGEQKLKDFLAANKQPFPVIVDAYGVTASKYVKKGSGFQIPQIFVIDARGKLRKRVSAIDKDTEADVVKLLEDLVR